MKCPKCGYDAADGCIICPECLTQLSAGGKAASAPVPGTRPEQKKTEEKSAPEQRIAEEKPAPKKRHVLRTILLILGALLVLAAAAWVMLTFSGCADKDEIDNELFAVVDANGEKITGEEEEKEEDDGVVIFDPVAFPYADSPIIGTWVLLEDYEDGYDDWDYISELTSDGYVYEWYGDGLGYYEPLCTYEFTGDSITYRYADHDSSYSCRIDGDRMTTADKYGTECEYYRLSSDINLSVADVKALYGE